MLWLGIDVGGTFTDLVVYDPASGRITLGKVPSTPEDQSQGILHGIKSLGIAGSDLTRVAHGSTVATNTALERSGADIAVLVTAGHRDILITGRGNRTLMYNIKATAPEPIVARDRCFQIAERLDVNGQVVTALDRDAVAHAAARLAEQDCEAVAVCFLHSYTNPEHERAAADIVKRALPDAIIATSSEVLPEYREHERFSTTALNAYVAPRMRRYLSGLRQRLADTGCTSEVAIMTSSGGTLPDHQIEHLPVLSMLSGPAAGVIATQFLGKIAGYPNIITCDMGGTSTDVCLIRNGAFTMTGAGKVGIYPRQIAAGRHQHGRCRRRQHRILSIRPVARRPAIGWRGTGSGLLWPRRRRTDSDRCQRRAWVSGSSSRRPGRRRRSPTRWRLSRRRRRSARRRH